MKTDILPYARAEYFRLLRLPIGGLERHYNQRYMCFLRDLIAEQEGRPSEMVQLDYEWAVQSEQYKVSATDQQTGEKGGR